MWKPRLLWTKTRGISRVPKWALPIFCEVVLVETPTLVDKDAWDQGALLGPAGGKLSLYILVHVIRPYG